MSHLTKIEVAGLSSQFNLADGHSYINSEKYFKGVLRNLGQIWKTAEHTPIPTMEWKFKETFAEIYDLAGLRNQTNFSICPTASNSIDIVGAWARARKYKVGLIEPTFDNLAQLLKRREVELFSIHEDIFKKIDFLEKIVTENNLDALFLVNPNNPTGTVLDSESFSKLVSLCSKRKLTLILDSSFRFCHKTKIDEYTLLQASDVSYVILEDTGKIWPTLDTKASLLSYSEDLAIEIRNIYEELYLSVSNFSLALIQSFIEETITLGGISFIHSILQQRNDFIRTQLGHSICKIESHDETALMSVAWLNISETMFSDLQLTDYLASRGISVLPGRYFFWNSHNKNGHNYIRVALLKPDQDFADSLYKLKSILMCRQKEILTIKTHLLESLVK